MRRHNAAKLSGSILLALLSCALIAAGSVLVIPVTHVPDLDDRNLPEGWRPVAWPFLKDQFEAGIAVECFSATCPEFVRVTIRPKIGFCNCVTGVSDDEELERIGDVDLIDVGSRAGAPGQRVEINGLAGRSRDYLTGRETPAVLVRSIAFSHGCDVIVATATGVSSPEDRQRVMDLLTSGPLVSWVNAALGRQPAS